MSNAAQSTLFLTGCLYGAGMGGWIWGAPSTPVTCLLIAAWICSFLTIIFDDAGGAGAKESRGPS